MSAVRWMTAAPLAAVALVACGSPPAAVGPAPSARPPSPPAPTASAAPAVAAPAPVVSLVVRGHLLGHDGRPMRLAHVHLGGRTWPASADGAFRIEGARRGFVTARFTGVDHEPRAIGLFLDGREQEVDVRLGTYPREDAALATTVVVAHHRTEGEPPPVVGRALLQRKPNGTFAAEVRAPDGDLLYQLHGLVRGHSVNGPDADDFVYDGDGDYFSVLHATKGPRVVRVDPARLPPAGKPVDVRFADPDRPAARIASLHLAAMRRLDAGASPPADEGWRDALLRALAAERDPEVAAALRLAYLVPPPRASDESARVARELLDALSADDTLWGFHPEAALDAVELAGSTPAREAYLDQLLDGLREPEVAAAFLGARVRRAAHAGRDDELARLYPILRARFAGTEAARAASYFDPARRVRPGKELPDFDLPALADPRTRQGTRVTPAALHGKVVLIDFWGTWCMPCRNEMKFLEQAFARHHAEGFAIVSVAVRDKVDHVKNFRASVSPMPWTHVVLDDANEDATLQLFGVSAYPTPILVDADGRILALGDELRGEALEPAIAAATAAARAGAHRAAHRGAHH